MTRTIALVALALASIAFGAASANAAAPRVVCVFVADIGGYHCPLDGSPGSLSGSGGSSRAQVGGSEESSGPAAPVLQPDPGSSADQPT